MVPHGSTKARVLHWFVRGGTVKTPDGNSFPIDVDPLVVGRDPGAQIGVDDVEVSALHCELSATDHGVLVRDLTSTNGTFIGSTRVREAVVTMPTTVLVGGTHLTVEPATKQRVDVGFADHFGPLVGTSPKMRRVFSVLEKVSKTPLGVMILGEVGTGRSSRRAPCTRRARAPPNRSWSWTAGPSRRRWRRACSSGTRRARSRAARSAARGRSQRPTRGRSSSTSSESCRSTCSRRSSAPCRSAT